MTGIAPGGVTTSRGFFPAQTVICAAGAWSRRIGEMAGVDLPVTPLRRQIIVTGPIDTGPVPMTIDYASTCYFHREGPGLLIGMSDPDEQPGFHMSRSDAWLPRLTAALKRRAPALLDAGLATGWAGLYEDTPDHNALIGKTGDFLYATGFSGHGFLQAPAVGEVIRDLYLDRPPPVDVSPLTADRFASDAARPETTIV